MPISWNEIRDRSLAFSREWEKDKEIRHKHSVDPSVFMLAQKTLLMVI